MTKSRGTWKQSELPPVIGAVELALRRNDQSILSQSPSLEAADAHSIPSTPWPVVCAGQRPVILSTFFPHLQLIHCEVQIRERRYEGLRQFGDRPSPHCGSFAVHG